MQDMIEVRLPNKHASDWFDRCGVGFKDYGEAEIVDETERTITLRLSRDALADLISDSDFYATTMFGEYTDGVDYASAARRCLARLKRDGHIPN